MITTVVHGCSSCATSAGVMGCPLHGPRPARRSDTQLVATGPSELPCAVCIAQKRPPTPATIIEGFPVCPQHVGIIGQEGILGDLARMDPEQQVTFGQGAEGTRCMFCEEDDYRGPLRHKDSCVWVRAVRACSGDDDGQPS